MKSISSRARAMLLAVLAIASGLLDARHGVYPFDEGVILYGAHSLCRGEPIYGSVRVNYTPGVLWLTAGLFRLFGEHVIVPRLLMVALFACLVLTCRSILARLLATGIADLTALSLCGFRAFLHPHWTMISYTPFAIVLYLLAVRATLSSPPRWLLAGLCAGTALVFKQNAGALSMMAIGAAVALLARPPAWPRAALVAAAGSAIPVAAMLGIIAVTGDIARFWSDCVVANANLSESWSLPYPLLQGAAELRRDSFFYVPGRLFVLLYRHPAWFAAVSPSVPSLARLIYAVPPLSIALLLLSSMGKRWERDARRKRVALAVASALLLLMAWPLATILHWANASLGALLCAAAACHGRRRLSIAFASLLLSVACVGLGIDLVSVREERSPVTFRAGTLYTGAGTASHVGSVLSFIATNVPEGDPIFVIPSEPFYYFATGHENAIDDDYILPPWTDEARMREIGRELEERGVRFLIWTHGELPRFARFEKHARPLVAEIRRRYRVVFRTDSAPPTEVWERIPAPVGSAAFVDSLHGPR